MDRRASTRIASASRRLCAESAGGSERCRCREAGVGETRTRRRCGAIIDPSVGPLCVLGEAAHEVVDACGVVHCDQVRADRRVEAGMVFHDRERSRVGERVAGYLRPVDDPAGVAGKLAGEDVMGTGVDVRGAVDGGCSSAEDGGGLDEDVRCSPDTNDDMIVHHRDIHCLTSPPVPPAKRGAGVSPELLPHA